MSVGFKSGLTGASCVYGLHDAVVLLCCRLIKREVIVVQISESERELLNIVDQFAQRLVAAALYDEVVELLIESDDVFLVITAFSIASSYSLAISLSESFSSSVIL